MTERLPLSVFSTKVYPFMAIWIQCSVNCPNQSLIMRRIRRAGGHGLKKNCDYNKMVLNHCLRSRVRCRGGHCFFYKSKSPLVYSYLELPSMLSYCMKKLNSRLQISLVAPIFLVSLNDFISVNCSVLQSNNLAFMSFRAFELNTRLRSL